MEFPPHTRGCTQTIQLEAAWYGVSPAHAGMYRRLLSPGSMGSCFPRTRGDVPAKGVDANEAALFPPHTRGCTGRQGLVDWSGIVSPAHAGMYRHGRESVQRQRSFPAHAGMYRCSGSWATWRQCFPRTRGDVPRPQSNCHFGAMFPPHTRGCTPDVSTGTSDAVVSPAHAGMYPRPLRIEAHKGCFPRTRGDVP